MKQFWSMIRQFGWVRDEDRKDEALSGIRDAIAQQFNDIYGGNAGDLGAWQRLWEIVGEGDMPTDVKTCRAVSFNWYFHDGVCLLICRCRLSSVYL